MTEIRCQYKIANLLSKINLFDENEDLSLVDQLLSTRIFLVLLTIFLLIITTFAAISIQTQSKTIESPSESLFDHLSLYYRTTLSCPCQQTSILQKNLISFNLQYHPICSSQLINQSFISLFLSDNNMSEYWPLDYRIMIVSHLQILNIFCQTIQQLISDKLIEFANKKILSTHVLFRDVFYAEISALFQQLKTNTITTYLYLCDFLWFNIAKNRIYSGLRTNYIVQTNPSVIGGLSSTSIAYGTSNKSCICSDEQTCINQAGIYNWTGRYGIDPRTIFGELNNISSSLFLIPGLFVGCLPYYSLLQSTLECFFDQLCINKLQKFINILTIITPLTSSYFLSNTTINDLLNQLMIESWNEQSNFTNYYQICSPSSCTYRLNQRFNIIYVIITLISLFGGLKTIIYVSAPFIVKILRKITTTEKLLSNTKTLKEHCVGFINEIYQKIRMLNLFSSLSDVQMGIYSTRLYILFLTTSITILTFYISFSTHIRTITILNPSIDQYENLYIHYSSTLICPCSQLSISFSQIVTIQPYYHQICSNNFITDFILLYRKGATITSDFNSFDFRLQYVSWFQSLYESCSKANEIVTNQLIVFNDTQFVTSQVLAIDVFKSQMNIIIQQFQKQTTSSFLELFQFVRNSIQLNQFLVSGNTNARIGAISISNTILWRIYATNTFDNQCSCGTNSLCIRSQGFYCRSANCFQSTARPNQTIPGLFLSCLPIDSLLLSTLECFYNISCIQMLFDWITFENLNATINISTITLTPLDSSLNIHFSIDTNLSEIVSRLFIETWIDSINFTNYYHSCAPNECTYTFEERFNIIYLISTILGIIGGLSVTFRIITPLFVKFIRQYRQMSIKISNLINRIRQLNFYYNKMKNQSTDILIIQRQQLATRFYIINFCLALIIILFFISFSTQTHSKTISLPNESQFELLKSQYSSTISCPCSQIAISYSQFLFLNISIYHQICSSYFISSDFIKLIWRTELPSDYYFYFDAKILSSQIRILSSLCTLAKNAIDQKIDIFYSQKMITIQALTHSFFQIQVDSLIENFIDQLPVDFRQTLNYIVDILHANQLQNSLTLNWNIIPSNITNNYIMSTIPIVHNENDQICSCSTSSKCTRSIIQTGNITRTLQGIVFGCLPMYGLRLSSLECFYNSTCLQGLADFIGTNSVFQPLDYSIETRFNPISSISISTLIDELFIETWQNSSNYSKYYSICAPLTCQYSSNDRNSVLYILTTLLGLYGGLTVGLKCVIWYILLIYWKIYEYFFNRQRQVHPITENF